MVGMYLLAPSLAAVSLLGIVGSATTPNQPDSRQHAKPRLVAEFDAVRPASRTWLGITFDIENHWHIYWDGDGDTGQPVKAEFTLPPGCKVSDIVWPTPKRQILGEDILDYIYEDRVTLLVELETPESVAPGSILKIEAKLNWMECSEECLPQKAMVTLNLPVASVAQEPAKSTFAPRFEETRRRVPRSVEETARTVRSEWRDGTLSLSVPGAKGLIFYPHRTSAELANPLEQADVKKDRMELAIEPGKTDRVIGILEVVREAGDAGKGKKAQSEFFAIDHSPAKPTAASAEKSKDKSHK